MEGSHILLQNVNRLYKEIDTLHIEIRVYFNEPMLTLFMPRHEQSDEILERSSKRRNCIFGAKLYLHPYICSNTGMQLF